MDKVKVVERTGIERKSILGRPKKERHEIIDARDMYKDGNECNFSDGQSLFCNRGDCRTCSLPVMSIIGEGHSHTDSEVEDQSLRVLELERCVNQLQLEKAALVNLLGEMKAK